MYVLQAHDSYLAQALLPHRISIIVLNPLMVLFSIRWAIIGRICREGSRVTVLRDKTGKGGGGLTRGRASELIEGCRPFLAHHFRPVFLARINDASWSLSLGDENAHGLIHRVVGLLRHAHSCSGRSMTPFSIQLSLSLPGPNVVEWMATRLRSLSPCYRANGSGPKT